MLLELQNLFLLHFIFDMELSLLRCIWPCLGLKSNAINTKPKYMATVTALEHVCSFSKVENLTYRFLGQLELLCGGETVNYHLWLFLVI